MKKLIPLLFCLPLHLFAQIDLDLDPDFGNQGRAYLEIGPSNYNTAADVSKAVGEQSDGKLIVAGYSNDIGGTEDGIITLARFYPDGSLDTTFGDQGITKRDLWEDDEAWKLEILPDDKILVAGRSWKWSEQRMNIAKFTADGQIDSSFHHNGAMVHEVARNADGVFDMAVQADGKILLMGWGSTHSMQKDWIIRRLHPDGTVDASFANQGTWTFNYSGENDKATAIAVQDDGHILVGGYAEHNFLLLRLTPDGNMDLSFGTNGIYKIPEMNGAYDIDIDDKGRIIVGIMEDYSVYRTLRLLPDGTPDPQFGRNGYYAFDTKNLSVVTGCSEIELLPGGHILNVCSVYPPTGEESTLNLFILNDRGQLVQTFGNQGMKDFDLCDYGISSVSTVKLKDGGIAFTGSCTQVTGNSDFLVGKLKDKDANNGGTTPSAANKTFTPYPNPVLGGEITINIPKEWVGESYRVIDLTGRIAKEDITDSEQTKISLADLPPKTYYIRIKDQVRMIVITRN